MTESTSHRTSEVRDALHAAFRIGTPANRQNLFSATEPLIPAPAAWGEQLEVLRLEGIPIMREHIVFHRRTLIVADLLFNFGPDTSAWTRFLILCTVGSRHHPGMSRPFRMAVRDKAAFQRSVEALTKWDFDRIIVGHGEIVETDGKRRLAGALKEAGF